MIEEVEEEKNILKTESSTSPNKDEGLTERTSKPKHSVLEINKKKGYKQVPLETHFKYDSKKPDLTLDLKSEKTSTSMKVDYINKIPKELIKHKTLRKNDSLSNFNNIFKNSKDEVREKSNEKELDLLQKTKKLLGKSSNNITTTKYKEKDTKEFSKLLRKEIDNNAELKDSDLNKIERKYPISQKTQTNQSQFVIDNSLTQSSDLISCLNKGGNFPATIIINNNININNYISSKGQYRPNDDDKMNLKLSYNYENSTKDNIRKRIDERIITRNKSKPQVSRNNQDIAQAKSINDKEEIINRYDTHKIKLNNEPKYTYNVDYEQFIRDNERRYTQAKRLTVSYYDRSVGNNLISSLNKASKMVEYDYKLDYNKKY
jgi:hypothetical protein